MMAAVDSAEAQASLEASIREACEADDVGLATRRALEAYGDEILRFQISLCGDETLANDAFSPFCEHLWKGLVGFRWESKLRTWCYVVARNALRMVRNDKHRRRAIVPLEDAMAEEIAERLRSTTALYLRTGTKDKVAKLRRQLDPFDQDMLVLRIGRRMSWLEIARVMHDGDDEPEAAELKREAARLRKRFQRSKDALEALLRENGLGSDATG